MKRLIYTLSAVFVAIALGACSKPDVDSNGVPLITSADHPVVDGKAITPEAFWSKYCKDNPQTTFDSICIKVKTVVNQHSFDNPGPPVKW
jgi:hypothetical protein